MASWAEHWSRPPYNVGLQWSETVFTKTTGNKGKKDRGVELPQARKATDSAALQIQAAGCFCKMPASSPSGPVRQTRGDGDWISPAREEAQAKMEVALLLEGEAGEHCATSSAWASLAHLRTEKWRPAGLRCKSHDSVQRVNREYPSHNG